MANEIKKDKVMQGWYDFSFLAKSIHQIDCYFKDETAKAVNRHLTARNWLIGCYLFEYEQHGKDRAQYGARLIKSLTVELNSPSLSAGNLKMYRRFYQEFPMLAKPIKEYLSERKGFDGILPAAIGQLLIGQFTGGERDNIDVALTIGHSPIGQLPPDIIFSRMPWIMRPQGWTSNYS